MLHFVWVAPAAFIQRYADTFCCVTNLYVVLLQGIFRTHVIVPLNPRGGHVSSFCRFRGCYFLSSLVCDGWIAVSMRMNVYPCTVLNAGLLLVLCACWCVTFFLFSLAVVFGACLVV